MDAAHSVVKRAEDHDSPLLSETLDIVKATRPNNSRCRRLVLRDWRDDFGYGDSFQEK